MNSFYRKSNRFFRLLLLTVLLAAQVLLSAGCARREAAPEADFGEECSVPCPGQYNAEASLSVPTWITRIDKTWFIVDCYHNQVLYNASEDALSEPLTGWRVLTGDVTHPHTIAGDGTLLLVDDTDQNRVLVFARSDAGADSGSSTASAPDNGPATADFILTQIFDGIGSRPHFISYDEPTATFYVWSSMSGEMFLFRREDSQQNGPWSRVFDWLFGDLYRLFQGGSEESGSAYPRLYLAETHTIEDLAHLYIRSFTIIGDELFFVSGISSDGILRAPEILVCDKKSYEIRRRYPVPEDMAGMAQIAAFGVPGAGQPGSLPGQPGHEGSASAGSGSVFYGTDSTGSRGLFPVSKAENASGYLITISTDLYGSQDSARIILADSLEALSAGEYKDIYSDYFAGGGTPYALSFIDGSWYLTEHRLPDHAIWRFELEFEPEVAQDSNAGTVEIRNVTPVY